jgi:hypothetical protein
LSAGKGRKGSHIARKESYKSKNGSKGLHFIVLYVLNGMAQKECVETDMIKSIITTNVDYCVVVPMTSVIYVSQRVSHEEQFRRFVACHSLKILLVGVPQHQSSFR